MPCTDSNATEYIAYVIICIDNVASDINHVLLHRHHVAQNINYVTKRIDRVEMYMEHVFADIGSVTTDIDHGTDHRVSSTQLTPRSLSRQSD